MHRTKFVLTFLSLAIVSMGCAEIVKKPATSSATVSKETEAREEISSILFDQRTYFIGNQSFTTSIKELESTDSTTKSPNYRYQIVPKPTEQKGVAVTATSKHPGLRSFTGVVFVVNTGKEKVTISEICETTNPSKQPPAVPSAPRRLSEQIKCPKGSRSASTIVALQ